MTGRGALPQQPFRQNVFIFGQNVPIWAKFVILFLARQFRPTTESNSNFYDRRVFAKQRKKKNKEEESNFKHIAPES